MSIAQIDKVWKLSEQRGGARLALLALADYADDDGFAWPGLETIADKIKMSKRHTTRLMQALAQAGEVFTINRRGRGNLYVMTLDTTPEQVQRASEKLRAFGATDADILRLEKVTSDTRKVTPGQGESAILDKESDIAMAPDPSLPVKEPSRNPQAPGGDEQHLDTWFPRQPEHRQGQKAPGGNKPARPGSYAEAIVRFAERGGDNENWAVPPEAGGADDFANGPLDAFCALVGLNAAHLPDKKRKGWAKQLRELGGEWRAGPDLVARCIGAIQESEFSWKTYSTPYAEGFKSDLGILIGRTLGGGDPLAREVEPDIVVIGR